MKDNLENILKDKLENFELPYEASAWSQMQAKLDAKASPTTSRWYWFGGAAVIAILSSLLVMTWDTHPEAQQQRSEVEVSSPIEEQPDNVLPTPQNDETNLVSEEKEVNQNEVVIEYAPEKEVATEKRKETTKVESEKPQATPITSVMKQSEENKLVEQPVIDLQPEKDVNELVYTTGIIGSTLLCYNDELVIRNNSLNHKVRARVNGKTFELMHNEQAKISNITAATQVEYLNAKNEVIGVEYISLHEKPNLFFRAEANLFNERNGLPVIQISNTNEVYTGQWYLDGKPTSLNENDEIYCYTKGAHTLNYEVSDMNGCTYTEQKTVTVDKDFNLMANNALNPESIIPENRTFLPESLTRMNVPFTFRVIDPSNGGVMYETNDVTQPWDGIDIRTGQLAKYNQTFIWQVSLEKSIENAPKTYRGDVVLVQKR
ncbi:hypothetical protein SAMN05216474_0661 [Lishizhenia tianjinensis]|uniref:Uncharacterized protein n=1 Tax=Lishizhenia tianjinensis TaxID=477690 RepID=A0A1I6Y4S9_9FLAO|nr:hypothetical protein [Lishizhenia tianjinensis]SFT45549.1 hypothetical protein SAMN05216474_0661 [Lishizhenia tianjinensis]